MEAESQEETRLRLLAEPRNRAVLSVLNETARPLDVRELADELVERDVILVSSADYEEQRERTLISLHHDRLPKLDEAGLVDYDSTTNVATLRSYEAVDPDWEDLAMFDELIARFATDDPADETEIGVLEGRDAAIRRGRELADEADEELFCMYVSTDLLEEECRRRARDAIERGVDMYLGSQNPSVRDLARRHLPEATVWEPQQDWLRTPADSPKVGRLVLADREKVMLAILDGEDSGRTSDETALTGEGTANPLVVLVRSLLGPRIDHLDYQSEDFRNELPF